MSCLIPTSLQMQPAENNMQIDLSSKLHFLIQLGLRMH